MIEIDFLGVHDGIKNKEFEFDGEQYHDDRSSTKRADLSDFEREHTKLSDRKKNKEVQFNELTVKL